MLVDLHAHFPMHLLVDEQQRTHERARTWWRERWQGKLVDLVSRADNYQGPGGTPSVTEQSMAEGDVGVALSMLYQPFSEMDLGKSYGAPPVERYFSAIVDQHTTVEDYARRHPDTIAIAHSPDELDAQLGRGVPILIHAIEAGCQLGGEPDEVRANVAELARLGIAYVTVAHLFFRDIATNAPAIPFLPDRVYNFVFPQARSQGLTALGRVVVDALVDNGILIDITHMSRQSIADVFTLLDERGGSPSEPIPVIATHMAYDFGSLEYCFDSATIERVADSGGLLGCILCEHYMTRGLRGIAKTFDGSVKALCEHIDKIHEITGSYDHIAIGSDLDGYIKPALPGLEDMSAMRHLQLALSERYGPENAERITSGNALRVLRTHWGRPR